jgi:hypothetical protein
MSFISKFAEPPKIRSVAFKYGFLATILTLLAFDICWRLSHPPFFRGDRNINIVVALMLLFNHVAYQFRWPPAATIALRALAWSWLAFGIFYIFYSARVFESARVH